jgi:hypothetical protein
MCHRGGPPRHASFRRLNAGFRRCCCARSRIARVTRVFSLNRTGRCATSARRTSPGLPVSLIRRRRTVQQIQILRAENSDAQRIRAFDEFKGDRAGEIAAGHCFIALIGDDIVGYASYEPRGLLGQPLLTYLCVKIEFRRQGIATALVDAVHNDANGRILISSTEDWCVATQAIFAKLGWRRIGEISGVNKDGSSEWFYGIDLGA